MRLLNFIATRQFCMKTPLDTKCVHIQFIQIRKTRSIFFQLLVPILLELIWWIFFYQNEIVMKKCAHERHELEQGKKKN